MEKLKTVPRPRRKNKYIRETTNQTKLEKGVAINDKKGRDCKRRRTSHRHGRQTELATAAMQKT